MLICSGHVYEGISSPTIHSQSDRSLHEGINFFIVVLRTNGSTPILILCFRYFLSHLHSSFAFHISGILALCLSLLGSDGLVSTISGWEPWSSRNAAPLGDLDEIVTVVWCLFSQFALRVCIRANSRCHAFGIGYKNNSYHLYNGLLI